jgi:hypothetical protein
VKARSIKPSGARSKCLAGDVGTLSCRLARLDGLGARAAR